jgi:hypothetical protein
MTRFVVDCGVVLRLAADEFEVPTEHELLAPTLLRSQGVSFTVSTDAPGLFVTQPAISPNGTPTYSPRHWASPG